MTKDQKREYLKLAILAQSNMQGDTEGWTFDEQVRKLFELICALDEELVASKSEPTTSVHG